MKRSNRSSFKTPTGRSRASASDKIKNKRPQGVAEVVNPRGLHEGETRTDASRERMQETAIEPGLPIIDAHHHLRDPEGGQRYLLPELLKDVHAGHNVVATVAIEIGAMFRARGPAEYRAVGETEFLCGAAAMAASGRYGKTQVAAGIVGRADLMLGDRLQLVLEAHIAAGGGRFRGVRMLTAWDDAYVPAHWQKADIKLMPHLLADATFRRGFACLAPNHLSYDAVIFFKQIPELADLARTFPNTTIIVNHMAGPTGLGPYVGRTSEVFAHWRKGIRELGACSNVYIKIGGIRQAGIPIPGRAFGEQGAYRTMPSSAELAAAWRPYIETCIEAFSIRRCMFESNFPPESILVDYVTLWNAFKRASAGCTDEERAFLFCGAAATAYRLPNIVEMMLPAGEQVATPAVR
ncbi:MAG: amidohydrolase [Dongiaceae bacterium]